MYLNNTKEIFSQNVGSEPENNYKDENVYDKYPILFLNTYKIV